LEKKRKDQTTLLPYPLSLLGDSASVRSAATRIVLRIPSALCILCLSTGKFGHVDLLFRRNSLIAPYSFTLKKYLVVILMSLLWTDLKFAVGSLLACTLAHTMIYYSVTHVIVVSSV
jgi:hypothetical protein